MFECPICGKSVKEVHINRHIDSGCTEFVDDDSPPPTQTHTPNGAPPRPSQAQAFFQTPAKRSQPSIQSVPPSSSVRSQQPQSSSKRPNSDSENDATHGESVNGDDTSERPAKKTKTSSVDKVAPLAERMRPRTLDDVFGQELVGPSGVLRGLIENDRVPSMILWGGPGTGKTTIARLIAQTAGTRFVEINSTSSGVGECKKLFTEARNELSLTGRKTIIFCDEIHRFSKSQQDVFLGPVESGIITLIGATTENPSFKVISALLSRCRTFTLSKLTDEDILSILKRALTLEPCPDPASAALFADNDFALLRYLSSFSDGDARTALNLLSLALDLSTKPSMTLDTIKSALTKTLVYDRAGDQHYDTISAFHKSVRGSDPDATLYYLARMLSSGEDPLFIARRMVVIASEDVGLADNSLLPLATAAYSAAEKIGMPECRINLAHCAVALALAPKSTRSYRGLGRAMKALEEPGVAGLAIPLYLRNAPTRLMKEMGYGGGYKYNPDYRDGKVRQEYLPEGLKGRRFLEDNDLGDKVDEDLIEGDGVVKEELEQGTAEVCDGEQGRDSTVAATNGVIDGADDTQSMDDAGGAHEEEGDMILDPDGG